MHGDARGLQLALDDRLDFLDHQKPIHRAGKPPCKLDGKRMRESKLQQRRVGKRLANRVISRARDDEPEPPIGPWQNHVPAGLRRFPGQCGVARGAQFEALPDVVGRDDPACHVLHISVAARIRCRPFSGHHDALDVRDSRGQSQNHGRLETFRKLERVARHRVGFGCVRGLEHRQVHEPAPEARVLLVLRGSEADVVGHGDYKPRLDTDEAHGHQRIGGHVQAHVLHRGDGAPSGHRGAERDFERHLFVRGPLRVDAGRAGERVHDLGGGRSRIGGCDLDARFPGAARHRFIAREKFACGDRRLENRAHDFHPLRQPLYAP